MSFEVVSKDEWANSLTTIIEKNKIDKNIFDFISHGKLIDLMPSRSTAQSAGYDFRSPIKAKFQAGISYIIPTGFKCDFSTCRTTPLNENNKPKLNNIFLALYPRSSYGFKYGFQMLNTTGIIDKDYYNNPDNEGHIMVGFKVAKDMEINIGDKFCQGIFQLYIIDIYEDKSNFQVRSGGMGSTGK